MSCWWWLMSTGKSFMCLCLNENEKDTWRMSSVFWRSEIIDVLSDQERSVERSNIRLSHCRIMSSSKLGSLGTVTYYILMDLKQIKKCYCICCTCCGGGHVDLTSLPEPGGSRRMFRNSELRGRVLCPPSWSSGMTSYDLEPGFTTLCGVAWFANEVVKENKQWFQKISVLFSIIYRSDFGIFLNSKFN